MSVWRTRGRQTGGGRTLGHTGDPLVKYVLPVLPLLLLLPLLTQPQDWVNMQTRETLDYGIYRVSGYSDFALANRVSYEFGFVGPS